MSIVWKPNGQLNIATDPADLPQQIQSDGTIYSEAMVRCKNLRTTQRGVVKTRDGSTKLNAAPISATTNYLTEQNGDRYAFGSSIFRNEESIKSGLSANQWSGIKYNAYNDTVEQVFALNGIDRQRVSGLNASEWGIDAPGVAPTLTAGLSTGLTGNYNVKYTYCRKRDAVVVCESNPSPAASAAQALSNESLSITWVPSGDEQVTHVRVYRTRAGGSLYYHDQDVAIGTIVLDTTTADVALGSEVETDHDRPPLGDFVAGPTYDGTCFIALDNLLYYCKPKQPEYWPATYYIEVGSRQHPITCPPVFWNGQVYVLTANEIYLIQGTAASVFTPLPMKAKTGTLGAKAFASIRGKGLFHVGSDGIYLFSGEDKKITQEEFNPIFRGESMQGIPAVTDITTAILHYFNNYLYFGWTSAGYTYPTNFLVINTDSGRSTYYEYNDGSVVQFRALCTDDTNDRLIAADSDGYIRVLEDITATDDSGQDISWEAQTKDFILQTRAHFPRFVKYDVDASAATSCTGSVLLEDAVHQTHTITGDRNTRYRHVATGNGNRMAHRISGVGPVSIYAIESE